MVSVLSLDTNLRCLLPFVESTGLFKILISLSLLSFYVQENNKDDIFIFVRQMIFSWVTLVAQMKKKASTPNRSQTYDLLGPVPQNMVKCNPGLSQISNMVFLSKVMQLKVLLLLSLYNKIK